MIESYILPKYIKHIELKKIEVQMAAIEKGNGVSPTTLSGNGSSLLISVPSK